EFFSEINVKTGQGNPENHLTRVWTEDLLAVLWGLYTIPMSDTERIEIWDKLNAPVVAWKTLEGETIDAPRGYIASNHEMLWTMLFLPVRDLPLYALFYNSQYLQADYALKQKVPGFQAAGYDSLGAYRKMGIAAAAEFPAYIQRRDCAIPYAVAAGIPVAPAPCVEWLRNLIQKQGLLTPFGPLEAVGPEGKADVLSADSQYAIALLLGGGCSDDILKYLKTHKVAGSQATGVEFIRSMLLRKERHILATNSLRTIRTPTKPFPRPPERDYAAEELRYPPQRPAYDVLQNLATSPDDRHGANVYSPDGANTRWQVTPDGMTVDYSISRSADVQSRYAWWGTYLGKQRPFLSGYTDVRVTLPNDQKRHRFNLLLKREDTLLARPIPVNSSQGGVISEDGKWITATYPLHHRRRFARLPLTYVAFSIEDPVKNSEFPAEDAIVVKSVELINRRAAESGAETNLVIEEPGPLPALAPRPARPQPLPDAIRPAFTGSGAIGGSTEDISQEEDDLVYFEFDNVDTSNGFSGVWTSFEEVDLRSMKFLVMDLLEGPFAQEPNILRIEGKYQSKDSETIPCAWNIALDSPGAEVTRNGWRRFVLPVPKDLPNGRLNMLSFIYENYVGLHRSGSLEISSPVFATNATSQILTPLKPAPSRSLVPDWQIQRLDQGLGAVAMADLSNRTVEVESKVGWMGAKLYPSTLSSSLDGSELVITLEPLSTNTCTGQIELKSGRTLLMKTEKFRLNPDTGKLLEARFPLKFRPGGTGQMDYLAISGISGKYRVRDIRVLQQPPAKL
ncbi:MAG: hypothetical protein V2A34_13860, partial [Lentisphaerota bacterium]